MLFVKQLRERIRHGEITCSVRIWMQPRVKVGGRYRMEGGFIEVQSIRPITREDVTPELARRSGFKGLVDLLKIAQHGRGRNIYLVEFRYIEGEGRSGAGSSGPSRAEGGARTKAARPSASRRLRMR